MKFFRRAERNRGAWAFFERFEIPNLDNPRETYLTRWRIVQTPWFAIYLHRMDGPDSRPTLHDHPWSFVSFVLAGGYIERAGRIGERPTVREVTRVNLKRAEDGHAIVSLLRVPTWTFVLVGPRRRTWGYFTDDGWVPFDLHPHNDEFNEAMRVRRDAERGGR